MTGPDEARIAGESGDQAFARAHSTRGGWHPRVRHRNVFERAALVEERAGFVVALERDANGQVGIADPAQARLQRAGIVKGRPLVPPIVMIKGVKVEPCRVNGVPLALARYV